MFYVFFLLRSEPKKNHKQTSTVSECGGDRPEKTKFNNIPSIVVTRAREINRSTAHTRTVRRLNNRRVSVRVWPIHSRSIYAERAVSERFSRLRRNGFKLFFLKTFSVGRTESNWRLPARVKIKC